MENNENTINNEGPYAIVTDEYVYLTYSGGAAGGYTYVLGLLTIRKDQDIFLIKPSIVFGRYLYILLKFTVIMTYIIKAA